MQDSQGPTILRLTPEIRRRIYEYTGVRKRIDRGGLSIAMQNLGAFTFRRVMWRDYHAGPNPGFLISYRTIYNEVIPLLYSTQWFVIRYQPNGTLSALRALRPLALASIVNLKIILNQVSCHPERPGREEGAHCCHGLNVAKCCWQAECLRQPHTPLSLIHYHEARGVYAVILITGLDITIRPSLWRAHVLI